MYFMDRVLAFLVGLPVGILIMVYRYHLVRIFGKIGFFEDKIGPGGTYVFYILLGVVVWLGSLMYALGTFQEIAQATIGKLF